MKLYTPVLLNDVLYDIGLPVHNKPVNDHKYNPPLAQTVPLAVIVTLCVTYTGFGLIINP